MSMFTRVTQLRGSSAIRQQTTRWFSSDGSNCSLSVKDRIAFIKMHNPPVNALGAGMVHDLKATLTSAHENPEVDAIILHGDGNQFMAGADIKYMQGLQSGPKDTFRSFIVEGNKVVNELVENGPKPTVAMVHGLALGGGLELAMSANARVAPDGTQFGLPELKLGLIPGLGGTQRLPRLVGLQKSLEMILQSKNIRADEARQLGLLDAIAAPDQLEAEAVRIARQLADGSRPRIRALYDLPITDNAMMVHGIFKGTRKLAAKMTPPNGEHVEAAIKAIEAGVKQGGAKGLLQENASFLDICQGLGATSLMHIFTASKATNKIPGYTDAGLTPNKITKVGVIGGGLMGSGICTAFLMKGHEVVLQDINQDAVEAGVGRIKSNLMSRVKKGRMTQEKFDQTMALLTTSTTPQDFASCQMVIEAAIENIEIKQKIFDELQNIVSPECILATNTSTIDIDTVGKLVKDPSRLLGAHFFSPAHVMPLLEIVRTNNTSKQAIVDSLAVAGALGKTPVVVGNCAGFAVNRVFFPYGQGASILADHGVDIYRIDKVIAKFGMPMGPFRLADLVGVDVYSFVNGIFATAFPSRTYNSTLPEKLLAAKRLGEKSGAGYYKIGDKRQALPDPDIASVLGNPPRSLDISDEEIVERIFFPVVNEACRVVEEGMVFKSADLDVASVFGMGFPATRGGVVKWANDVGAAHIAERLASFAAHDPKLAGFYEPCEYLKQCAASGQPIGGGH